ncbi:uncharacterized protein LOC130564436 isoform X2 [Triplophysa rosa]|uniref:uncharacterized protein LOC130564436 isoform X2 n=1 Tax=Triplophysa rosa TaxID=992332 RepID=UPI002545C0B3|nr:uncharacterized protein LOC130564436 isoform X2 [Triplophysa rosa]
MEGTQTAHDFIIVKCSGQCRERANFHCCFCEKTIIHKSQLTSHILSHPACQDVSGPGVTPVTTSEQHKDNVVNKDSTECCLNMENENMMKDGANKPAVTTEADSKLQTGNNLKISTASCGNPYRDFEASNSYIWGFCILDPLTGVQVVWGCGQERCFTERSTLCLARQCGQLEAFLTAILRKVPGDVQHQGMLTMQIPFQVLSTRV